MTRKCVAGSRGEPRCLVTEAQEPRQSLIQQQRVCHPHKAFLCGSRPRRTQPSSATLSRRCCVCLLQVPSTNPSLNPPEPRRSFLCSIQDTTTTINNNYNTNNKIWILNLPIARSPPPSVPTHRGSRGYVPPSNLIEALHHGKLLTWRHREKNI